MQTYELTYIISPEVSSVEAELTAKEIEALIQSSEGAVLRQEKPTIKTLAHPVKKHISGFVSSIEFQIEAEKLSELQNKMQKDGKIVRHLVIIKKPVRIKKQRRQRVLAPIIEEIKQEPKKIIGEKQKVELKDIEQKLDEILGE
ncbi:MAG: 30S ribosomal protein S6 [Candidatus Staskawiczbacteria bacterium]|nr:30S ribosomal protein S6 [Candidatus Staskawiczbacteria bacterium]